MLNKQIISLMLCAVLAVAVMPSIVVSQTQARPEAVLGGLNYNNVQAQPKPDLKKVFAERLARIKDGTLAEADFKRQQQDPQDTKPAKKPRFTKSEKIILIGGIIGITVLVVLVATKGVKNPPAFCDTAPFDPNCI